MFSTVLNAKIRFLFRVYHFASFTYFDRNHSARKSVLISGNTFLHTLDFPYEYHHVCPTNTSNLRLLRRRSRVGSQNPRYCLLEYKRSIYFASIYYIRIFKGSKVGILKDSKIKNKLFMNFELNYKY